MPASRFHIILKFLDTSLQRVLICLLSALVAVILPITLFQFCIMWWHRKTVFLLARIFKGRTFSKPLTLQSGMIANVDTMYTSPKLSIVVPVVLEGTPDIQKFRDTIKTKLLDKMDPKTGNAFYPELLQNVGFFMGYPFWKRLDPFKVNKITFLRECVHFYKNDETTQYDYHSLQHITKELCFKPYAKDMPMIEFILVPDYTPHPEKQPHVPPCTDIKYFVFIVRIHHALGDGYAMIRLFENFDINPVSDTFDLLKPKDYTPRISGRNDDIFPIRVLKHAIFPLKMLYQLSEYIYKSAQHCSERSLWEWEDRKPASPKMWKKVPKGQLAQKQAEGFKTSWSKPFTLAEINEIKTIHGVSGTSVMYAAVLEALRETMFSERIGQDNIPPYISFGMTLPLPRKNDKLRNFSALTTVFVPLGESDPVNRLHKVQQCIDLMKASTLPTSATFLTSGILGLTPRPISSFIDEITKFQEFVVVSNIAGPRNMTFDMAGYVARDIFWTTGPAIDRNCLFVSLISAKGIAKLGLTGNSRLLKSDENADVFISNFFEELQNLKRTTPVSTV